MGPGNSGSYHCVTGQITTGFAFIKLNNILEWRECSYGWVHIKDNILLHPYI